MGLLHVGLGPVGTQGAQQQPRHDPLTLLQGRQSAQQGDEGVRAGVQQVVVPEGAQGRVLGAVGPQRHAPRPLPLFEPQGVLLPGDLADEGLGIVGGDLAPDRLLVETAGHQGHAVHVSRQLQREGLGHRNGAEQVLHSQQGALPDPRRRHRQQHGEILVPVVVQQPVDGVQLHGVFPSSIGRSLYWAFLACLTFYPCLPGLHSMTSVSSGVASMRTGKRCPFVSSRPSPLGQDSSQRCSSTGRSKASPTVLMAAASC